MKKFIAGAITALALIATPTADAHRYSKDLAYSKVMNLYRNHCGNGITWICTAWPNTLGGYETGYHSWNIRLSWLEGQIGSSSRRCEVEARVEHDWVAEIVSGERCN